MNLLTKAALQDLLPLNEEPCVSLYLPVERPRARAHENIERMRSALASLETDLKARGISARGSAQFVAPARALLESEFADGMHGDAVVLFLSPSFFRAYVVPFHVPDRRVIGHAAHITPLLPFFFGETAASSAGRGAFDAAVHAGRSAMGLHLILPFAHEGRVDTLLLAKDALQWGSIDADARTIVLHDAPDAMNEELCGLAVIWTLRHKGIVALLPPEQMPENSAIAAALRY